MSRNTSSGTPSAWTPSACWVWFKTSTTGWCSSACCSRTASQRPPSSANGSNSSSTTSRTSRRGTKNTRRRPITLTSCKRTGLKSASRKRKRLNSGPCVRPTNRSWFPRTLSSTLNSSTVNSKRVGTPASRWLPSSNSHVQSTNSKSTSKGSSEKAHRTWSGRTANSVTSSAAPRSPRTPRTPRTSSIS